MDLKGAQVWPAFTDMHTHIDKGHIWNRRPNPDGSFEGALTAVRGDRDARWNTQTCARAWNSPCAAPMRTARG